MDRIETGRKHRVVLMKKGFKRTPILSIKRDQISAKDLGVAAIRAVIREMGLKDLSKIGAIPAGEVAQSAFTSNSSTHVAQAAGLPGSIQRITMNRQCSSSMDAVNAAFNLIADGHESLVLVLGIENMAHTPYLVAPSARHSKLNRWLRAASQKPWGKALQQFGFSKNAYGPGVLFGFYAESGLATSQNALLPEKACMTKTAQVVSNLCGISRGNADCLAALSQRRALASRQRASEDIVPVFIPGVGMIEEDENVRETLMSTLTNMRAVPDSGGFVTAGNASGMGACGVALMLASEEMARELGAKIIAEVVDFQASGFDARAMGLGPVTAINTMLARHALTVEDIDYWEINEAFAHVWAAIMKAVGIEVDKCNAYGGGISLGHPLGATGARILWEAVRELNEKELKRVVAAQCAAGGMGTAVMAQFWQPGKSKNHFIY